MKRRRHVKWVQAVVVLLLCSALSLSVVSVGVGGNSVRHPSNSMKGKSSPSKSINVAYNQAPVKVRSC
jgi:hypothetical protein